MDECKYVRWETGRHTGRTGESWAVISDQARDVHAGRHKIQDPFAYGWTIHRTIQDLLPCLTAAILPHIPILICTNASFVPQPPLVSPKTFHVFRNIEEFALTTVSRGMQFNSK